MINSRKPALIYARVASWTQSNSFPLESQIFLCREYAARNGFDVEAIFSDLGSSGTTIRRSGLMSMLEHLQDNSSTRFVVIVDGTARLTCSLDHYFALQRKLKAIGAELRLYISGSTMSNSKIWYNIN